MTEPNVIADNDIQRARIKRDLASGELRQRLTIEWRGDSYELVFNDFECGDGPPDEAWMWRELRTIVDRQIPLKETEEV